jgi:hypothetical protein
MKTNYLQNLRPFIILFLIITACIFWIVRLEIKASALVSRVEELHKSLDQNKDVLAGLEIFSREVNSSDIEIDAGGVKLSSGMNMFLMDDKKGSIIQDKTELNWDKDNIILENDPLTIHLSKIHDQLYFGDGNAAIRIGDIKGTKPGSGASVTEQGIMMLSQPPSKKGGYMLLSDNEVRIKSQNVPLSIESESSDFFGLKFDKKKEVIELWNKLMRIYLDEQKGRIYVGNTYASLRIGKIEGSKGELEEGIIILNNPNSNKGGYVLISDNVLRIKSTKVPVEIVKGNCTIKIKDDKIEFYAEGDINITSENGNVNLVGKRINFNE